MFHYFKTVYYNFSWISIKKLLDQAQSKKPMHLRSLTREVWSSTESGNRGSRGGPTSNPRIFMIFLPTATPPTRRK